MNIAIIGSGNMAHGIGTRLATGSHSLTIVDRDSAKAKELAQQLGKNVKGEALGGAIDADIVIFALPYPAIAEVMDQNQKALAGKVLVDISNPVDFQTFTIIPERTTSGAEQIATHVPAGARLVKAFNTTFSKTLVAGKVDGKTLDVLIASDDKDAADMVGKLVDESGMRGLYVGPLSTAQTLEGMGLMHMKLQERLGSNWMSTIKFLS